MTLLQATVIGYLERVGNIVTDSSGMNAELWSSIVMPFIILLFCSFVKSVVGVNVKDIKWFDFFTEMAVDLLTVFGTFIIGRYFLINSSQAVLLSSAGKLGILALTLVIVTVLRRAAHHFINQSNPSYCWAGIMLCLEYLLDIFSLIFVFRV